MFPGIHVYDPPLSHAALVAALEQGQRVLEVLAEDQQEIDDQDGDFCYTLENYGIGLP